MTDRGTDGLRESDVLPRESGQVLDEGLSATPAGDGDGATPLPRGPGGILRFARAVVGRGFVRDAAGLSAAEAVILVLNLVQAVLLARWLGPRTYGIVAVVMAYPTVVYAAFESQSSHAAVRYLGEFVAKAEGSKALAMVRLSYVVDTTLALVALLLVASTAGVAEERIVREEGTAILLVLYSAAFAFHGTTSTSRSILLTAGRFPAIALTRVATNVLGVGLSLGLVVAGRGVSGVVWGSSAGMVADGLVLGLLGATTANAWGGSWWSASWQPLKGRYREILRFVAYSDLEGLFGLIARRLDIVLLGFLRGPTEVGYYRIARAVSALPGHLIWPLEFTAFPRLASIKASEGDAAVLARGRRYAVVGGLPLGAMLLLAIPLMPFLIELAAGNEYAPAGPAAQVLLAGSAVWLAAFWVRPLVLTLGHVRFWALNSGVFVLLSLIAFLLLTPTFGFLAMAWVYAVMLALQHLVPIAYLALRARAKRGAV